MGLSAAMIGVNFIMLILFVLTSGFAALLLGSWFGNKIADCMRVNISWMAGVILVGLAFWQLA